MRRAVALASLLPLLASASAAHAASFAIPPGSFAVRALDAEGQPETRAGSHPDRLDIEFGLESEGTSAEALAFEMPPGLVGSPGSVPPCPRELYERGEEECPASSQIGESSLEFSGGGEQTLPIFAVEPAAGELLASGSAPGVEAKLRLELRPGDLGVTFEESELPEAAISGGRIELWGVPADRQSGTSIPRRPLLTLPTACGPMAFGFRARSHEPAAPWVGAAAESAAPLDGCQNLAFDPSFSVQLSTNRADSQTGARIELDVPQNEEPDGLASAQLDDATIELPEGLTISPEGAAGASTCGESQFGLGNADPPSCPASSRVGTMEIASGLSSEPLVGSVYLGEPTSQDPVRMFVAATGPGGIVVKFASAMQLDSLTGRLSAVLSNLPPLPLSRIVLDLGGGSGTLLASPLACGRFPATATLTSHSSAAPLKRSSPVSITASPDGAPCPGSTPFAPTLTTTSSSHLAGKPTTISMTLRRLPGEQLTRRFAVSLPPGLSPSLSGVEACSDAAAPSGACPPGSRMGTAVATVGSGSSPVAISGDVYAAGPYQGAPFSMVLALHASLGPFGLGTTTTRTALRADPRSGRVSVVTAPLPALVEGLPIRIQSITLNLNRPGSLRNPTSCGPARFDATVEATSGATAALTSTLPLSGCRRLGLRPRFSVALTGRSQLRPHGRPGFQLTAHMRRGDTNFRALRMAFPAALGFTVSGIGAICPRIDARDGLCSPKARVGTVVARSALQSKPLRGSVYVVAPKGNGPPDLGVSIAAGGTHLFLSGRMSAGHGDIATNLAGMPDLALSSLKLRLLGGKHGSLLLGAAPCVSGRDRLFSRLTVEGQNGAVVHRRVRVKAPCS